MKKILAGVVLVVLVGFAVPAMAASNPFADVPAGHWSYDAVALLASHGVVSGYSDGQYKGEQHATRYEMASVVARALKKIDIGKASNEDVVLVKRLVTEYKNELDALGVKFADLDKRVAGLEKGLKGLSLKGIFWLDAEWGGRDSGSTAPKFEYHRARFFIEKQVDANTFFQMRTNFLTIDGKGDKTFRVDRLWFSTKLPWDIKGTFGYQVNDWDAEYGLYDTKYGGWGDEDAFWTDLKFMGFDFYKDFGKFDVDAYVGRNTQTIDDVNSGKYDDQNYMTCGLKVGYKGEKLKLGVFARGSKFDGDKASNKDSDGNTKPFVGHSILNYGVYANYKIMNGLALKGTFNHQNFRSAPAAGFPYQNADYWQAVAEADQSLLKLFALWVQYGQVGEGFVYRPAEAFNEIGYNEICSNFANESMASTDFKFLKVGIHRDFTKKFKGYAMYEGFRDTKTDVADTKNFAVGFRYQYTPAIAFQLQYDWRDYGETKDNYINGREDLFRFRTIISF